MDKPEDSEKGTNNYIILIMFLRFEHSLAFKCLGLSDPD